MDTTSLAKRSKVKSLPDDLRGIAEAMLREKFPEKVCPWFGVDYAYTQSVSVGTELTEKSLLAVVDMMKRRVVHDYGYMPMYKIEVDQDVQQGDFITIKAGTLPEPVNPYPDGGFPFIIMKPRNYGKSNFYKEMYERGLAR